MNNKLIYVLWDITQRCTLVCKHCRIPSNIDLCSELSTEKCKKIIDQLSSINLPTLSISGGDPLLRKDLCELVKYATNKSIRVKIQTNGQCVNEKNLQDLKKAGCSEFGIGLDGDKNLHDWLRDKKGAFEKAINTIKLIKSKGFRTHVEFTLNPKNKNKIQYMLNLCKTLKVDTFFSRCVIPFGKGADSSLLINKQMYSTLLNKLCSEKYQRKNIAIGSEDPLWILVDKKMLNGVKKKHPNIFKEKYRSGCLAGRDMIYINPSGDVFPCSFLDIKLGNLNKESLIEILNNRHKKIPFINRDKLKGKCNKCDLRYLCGGCRSRAFYKYGDYLAEDPLCMKDENHKKN